MIDKISLIAVYPEIILLVMACVILLFDLRVKSRTRTATYVVTMLTLAVVAALHLELGEPVLLVTDRADHALALVDEVNLGSAEHRHGEHARGRAGGARAVRIERRRLDMPRVVDILARELGIAPEQVTKKGPGSEFLFRPTKKVEAADD